MYVSHAAPTAARTLLQYGLKNMLCCKCRVLSKKQLKNEVKFYDLCLKVTNCMLHYMAFIVFFSALPSTHLLLLHCVDNFDAVSLFCYVCFVLVNCCSSRSSIGIVHSVRNLSRSLLSLHSRPLSA